MTSLNLLFRFRRARAATGREQFVSQFGHRPDTFVFEVTQARFECLVTREKVLDRQEIVTQIIGTQLVMFFP